MLGYVTKMNVLIGILSFDEILTNTVCYKDIAY